MPQIGEKTWKFLIIEDSSIKAIAIEKELRQIIDGTGIITRAATLDVAKTEISKQEWDLVFLDISMDIRASSTGRDAGGHDVTGGLKIAERMFLLGQESKVIIVTAFDAFPIDSKQRGAVLGLQDVLDQANKFLGDWLVGWVRYSETGWNMSLARQVKEVLKL
ncbi:MAG: hypothetical protein ABJH63_15190 [Rhizobiaceae bacterium]